MTEEHVETAFGAMQEGWSDRRAFRNSIWVNTGGRGQGKVVETKYTGLGFQSKVKNNSRRHI